MSPDDQGVVEFDTVAGWVDELLADMPRHEAVVGACRGSANPAALAWLAESLSLRPGVTLGDVGGGIGGPAAWAVDRHGASVVLLEPMRRAATAARRRFGLPAVIGSSAALPWPDASFDAVWALGVISTVDDRPATLAEMARVLRPGGRAGVLEYVRTGPIAEPAPPGNDFSTADELVAALGAVGLALVDRLDDLPPRPATWATIGDRIAAGLAARHPGADEIDRADQAEHRFADLLSAGTLAAVAVVAERAAERGGDRKV